MGNSFCQNMSSVETPEIEAPPLEENQDAGKNLIFHLFSYREQMGLKKHKTLKWASSKLLLTEHLLKAKENWCQRSLQQGNTSWITCDESLLTDDEDDELMLRQDEPDQLTQELSNLEEYRMTLRGTILQIAKDSLKKREKKSLKRLKRRTLISSKKPSDKAKQASAEAWTRQQSVQKRTQDKN